MNAPRTCLDCGKPTLKSRCILCTLARDRMRNAKRADYYDTAHRNQSKAARKAQPWCSECGSTIRLSWDHEHRQVECQSCNSSHRRNPT